MNELQRLRQELSQAIKPFSHEFQWGKPEFMSKALTEVQKKFDSPIGNISQRSAEKALISFRNTRILPTYLELKYVCFALVFPVNNWRLLDDEKLFLVLLDAIQQQIVDSRRFRKCYQGVLAGYWTYPVLDDSASEYGRNNWKKLRNFLKQHLAKIVKENPTTTWVNTLKEHENLLEDEPCERYGADLLQGNDSQFSNVRIELGIPSNSWVIEQAIYSQTEAACKKPDQLFKGHLESLLALTSGRGDLHVSENIIKTCLAKVLNRYSKCSQKTEHTELRNSAITHFGNPWLKPQAWDAFVKCEDARKMVESWLKIRLITDFFSLLSEDGAADERRLKYWLRFEPAISDMWFVLGPYANHNRSKEFVEIRQRAKGRLITLDHGGTPQNNAFIMRIGQYVLVEFSAKGNAFFIFEANSVPFQYQGYIDCPLLRSSPDRLIHRDSPTRNRTWEDAFDEKLLPLINFQPKPLHQTVIRRSAHRSDYENIEKIANALGLEIKDNRSKNGAFWVETDNSDSHVNKTLRDYGFQYKSGRGWWRE